MYIKIEFIIIAAVFFTMLILVSGLGWYMVYLRLKGESGAIAEKKRQQPEIPAIEKEQKEGALLEAEEKKEAQVEGNQPEKPKREAGKRLVVELLREIRVSLGEILDIQEQILKADSIGDAKKGALEAKKSGEALLSIIGDILDVSRMDSGQYKIMEKPYHLGNMLREILSAVSVKAHKKGIVLTANISEEMPSGLIGDERLMKRVFALLLEGAVRNTEVGIVCFNLDCRMEKDRVCLMGSIDDTGTGIRQEDMEHIFDLDEDNRDIALDQFIVGLNFCRKSLMFLGGGLQMESIYGTGTKILFEVSQKVSGEERVPVGEPAGEVSNNEKTIKKVSGNGNGKGRDKSDCEAAPARVLIVDDNIVNVKVVTNLLEPYGLDITSAYSGQQCLDEVARNQDYKIIFLDYMMPGIDGIETLHRLRAMEGEYFAQVPVVALTATVLENTREIFEKEGFQELVTKPVDVAEMERVLKKYIHRGKRKAKAVEERKSAEQAFSIENVDISIGLRQWNGNLDKYKMILEVVDTDGRKKLKEMRQHLEAKDYENYMIEAHSAKSVTASIGAMKVSELAKEQEFAVKNQELSVVEEKSEVFLKAYEELLCDIARVLELSQKPGEERKEPLLPITLQSVEERLWKVSQLIDAYEDEEAVRQLKDLLRYDIEIYSVDFIEGIIEDLNRLDYAKASDRIKNRRSEFDEEDIISRR